ncbi:hypothetical protein K438DRAFT_722038 [Mycena galopus ATCC 62051]|nr:hypothetical protein K438DRAFT_722038 [Mycena galopus ATCC 62051]
MIPRYPTLPRLRASPRGAYTGCWGGACYANERPSCYPMQTHTALLAKRTSPPKHQVYSKRIASTSLSSSRWLRTPILSLPFSTKPPFVAMASSTAPGKSSALCSSLSACRSVRPPTSRDSRSVLPVRGASPNPGKRRAEFVVLGVVQEGIARPIRGFIVQVHAALSGMGPAATAFLGDERYTGFGSRFSPAAFLDLHRLRGKRIREHILYHFTRSKYYGHLLGARV